MARQKFWKAETDQGLRGRAGQKRRVAARPCARRVADRAQPLPHHRGRAGPGPQALPGFLPRLPRPGGRRHGPGPALHLPAAAQLHHPEGPGGLRRHPLLPDHERHHRHGHALFQTRAGVREDLGRGQLRGRLLHQPERRQHRTAGDRRGIRTVMGNFKFLRGVST